MRPPLCYYGGKQKMADHIIQLLPKHHHYIEPFCGGAAVFWAKGPLGPPSRYTETLNDSNENIISLYRVLQNPSEREQLFERLRFTPHSRSEWLRARVVFREPKASVADRAWATLVAYNQSRASAASGWGWRRGTTRSSKSYACTWRNRVDSILHDLEERLRWVQIDCGDALEAIERYDCPGAVFYCDPPYLGGCDQGPYSGYTQSQLEHLVDVLERCQGSVVLSGYANPAVPAHWERYEFDARAWSVIDQGKGSARTEVVWRVNRSDEAQMEMFRP